MKAAARRSLMRENKGAGRAKQMRRANKKGRTGKRHFHNRSVLSEPSGRFFASCPLYLLFSGACLHFCSNPNSPRCPGSIYPPGMAPGPTWNPQPKKRAITTTSQLCHRLFLLISPNLNSPSNKPWVLPGTGLLCAPNSPLPQSKGGV